jgi:DNA-binding response OmpR family regulator
MAKQSKILLVDDDKDLVQVVKMALELNGFKVTTSGNGQEANFKFGNDVFDAVVTDLMMPKMDGIEFITAIQKISQVPIFVISASVENNRHKLKDIKGLVILPKPFDTDVLCQKLKAAIKLNSTTSATAGIADNTVENVLKFRAGDVVIEESAPPTDIFIVKDGTFSVHKRSSTGEKIAIAIIKPGEVLGEMAVFTGQSRTTTVIAQTDGTLIRFPMDKVKETLNSQPAWFKVLMKTISTRLSDTTTALAEAKSKTPKE